MPTPVNEDRAQHVDKAGGTPRTSAAAPDARTGGAKTKFEDDREAWLAGVLEEQRQISERQILQQHELLRLHFDATLQACFRTLPQALGGNQGYDVSLSSLPSVIGVGGEAYGGMDDSKASMASQPTVLEEQRPARKTSGGKKESKERKEAIDAAQLLRSMQSRDDLLPPSWLAWSMGMPLDIFAVSLIVVNTIFMMANSLWLGYEIRVQLGIVEPGAWQGAETVFKMSEILFTVFFLFELISRLMWNGLRFLKDPLNLIDATVVVLTTLDTLVFSQLDFKAGVSAIRLIRLVKLFKTFRFAKALKMVQPLRILLRTISSSVLSLFWSMCILFMFMLVSAILASQTVQQYIQDESNDMDMRLWCEHHYGDVVKALWTMFLITMSGGWPTWVNPLVYEISVMYSLLFGAYVTLVVFAVIRVITALFLKDTLAQAAKDADDTLKDKIKTKQQTVKRLEAVFDRADKNKDGCLTEAEFDNALGDPKIMKMFYELEMEPSDLEGVFQLLDDGHGTVELEEFLSGIMKMKGHSRATDLLILQHDNKRMLYAVQTVEKHMLTALAGIDKHLDYIQKLEEKVNMPTMRRVHNL